MALLTEAQEKQLTNDKIAIDKLKADIITLQTEYEEMKKGVAVTMTVLPNGSFTINDAGSAINELMDIVNQLKQIPQEQLRLKEREINTKNGEISVIKQDIMNVIYGVLSI